MTFISFNTLWLISMGLLLVALVWAINRRRKNTTPPEGNFVYANPTSCIRQHGQDIRIHMTDSTRPPIPVVGAASSVQQPARIFNPHEQAPPPSYQESRKDIQIQPRNV